MSTDAAESAPAVTHAPQALRYEIHLGQELAGFTEYRDDENGRRIFFHTEIGERFGGRGLAGRLVGEALTDTRAAGLRVVPVCPFVKKFVRGDDYADIVDPVTPQVLEDLKRLRG